MSTHPQIVSSIRRYPVKSMAGEEIEAADVTERGLTGDRSYALMDTASNKIGTAKSARKFGGLLNYGAKFAGAPVTGEPPPAVRITLPDGAVLHSDRPADLETLTAAFGSGIRLISTAPEGLMLTKDSPVASGAPAGTLFDYAGLHIITSATLNSLKAEYPEGEFVPERFRPNLVVDCAGETGFVENGWIGKKLAIGPQLVVRVLVPCPRCVMTTLPQGDLAADPGILRTAAQRNKLTVPDFGELPCVGVYAEVLSPGQIRRNDAVRLVD